MLKRVNVWVCFWSCLYKSQMKWERNHLCSQEQENKSSPTLFVLFVCFSWIMAVCTNTVVDSCLKKGGGGIISAPVTNINRRYANKTVKNKTKLCFFLKGYVVDFSGQVCRWMEKWRCPGRGVDGRSQRSWCINTVNNRSVASSLLLSKLKDDWSDCFHDPGHCR